MGQAVGPVGAAGIGDAPGLGTVKGAPVRAELPAAEHRLPFPNGSSVTAL